MDPYVDAPDFRSFHCVPKAFHTVGKIAAQPEVPPAFEGFRVVEIAETSPEGDVHSLIDGGLTEGEDHIGRRGRASLLSPLPIDHGMRESLRHLDGSNREQGIVHRAPEQGDPGAHDPPVLEGKNGVTFVPPVGDNPLLVAIPRVCLKSTPEGVRFGRLHPVEHVTLPLFAQIREVPRFEDIELGHGVVFLPGVAPKSLGVQRLEPHGELLTPDHAHRLPDDLPDGGGIRPPDGDLHSRRIGHRHDLQGGMGGSHPDPNPSLEAIPVTQRQQAVAAGEGGGSGFQIPATHSQGEEGGPDPRGKKVFSGAQVGERADHPFFGDADFQGTRLDIDFPTGP